MFEKVLIATDFSKHAKKVIECIGEMPGLKEVLLLNVISRDPLARVWDPVSEIKDIEKKLEEEKNAIKSPGVTVNVKAVSVLEGEVASAINKVAMEENVSLVAMGARGRSLIMSTLLGSSSRNVLRFGRTHLLIMRYKTLDDNTMEKYCARVFARILFPTDLSQTSEVALSFLKSLKGIGEIVLLNVVSKGETDEEIEANVALAKDWRDSAAQCRLQGGDRRGDRGQCRIGQREDRGDRPESEDVGHTSHNQGGCGPAG